MSVLRLLIQPGTPLSVPIVFLCSSWTRQTVPIYHHFTLVFSPEFVCWRKGGYHRQFKTRRFRFFYLILRLFVSSPSLFLIKSSEVPLYHITRFSSKVYFRTSLVFVVYRMILLLDRKWGGSWTGLIPLVEGDVDEVIFFPARKRSPSIVEVLIDVRNFCVRVLNQFLLILRFFVLVYWFSVFFFIYFVLVCVYVRSMTTIVCITNYTSSFISFSIFLI